MQSFTILRNSDVEVISLANKLAKYRGQTDTISDDSPNLAVRIDNEEIINIKLSRISQSEPPPLGGSGEKMYCVGGNLIPRSQVFLPSNGFHHY